MEVPGLPLDFYCRSACRCLKKAASSRKTCLFTDELQHLQKFESIVLSTIPSHPHYSKRKGEKAILELQIYLLEARKRMQKLHGRFVPRSQTVDKVTTKTVGRRFSRTLLERTKPFVKLRTNPRKTINSPRKQDWEAWVRKLHESYSFLGPSSSRSGMPGVSKKKRLTKERYFHNLPASSTIDPNKSLSIKTSCPVRRWDTVVGDCAVVTREVQVQGERKDGYVKFKSKQSKDDAGKTVLCSTLSSVQHIGELSRKLFEWSLKYEEERFGGQLDESNQEIIGLNQNLDALTRISERKRALCGQKSDISWEIPFSADLVCDKLQETMAQLQKIHSGESTSYWKTSHASPPGPAVAEKKTDKVSDICGRSSDGLTSLPETCASGKGNVQRSKEKICRFFEDRSHSLGKEQASRQNSPSSVSCNISKIKSPKTQKSCKESHAVMSYPSSPNASAVNDKIAEIGSSMKELKEFVERSKVQLEEEGQHWRDNMDKLEKKLEEGKDDTMNKILALKTSIQDDVQRRSNELFKELASAQKFWHENETKEDISNKKIDFFLKEYSARIDTVKKQVDSTLLETKALILKEIEEKLVYLLGIVKQDAKNNVEALELGMFKDIENLRQEMARYELHLVDVDAMMGGERQQLEVLIKETMEKRLSEKMETSAEGKARELSGMRNELHLLSEKVEALKKGDGFIQENVEKLTQLVEKVRERTSDEQDNLKSENLSLKKQLQYVDKEGMEARIELKDFRKDCETEMEEIKLTLARLKDDETEMKKTIECVKSLEDSLKIERINPRRLVEMIKKEEEMTEELQNLKRIVEECEKGKERFKLEGVQERVLMIDKVESLSQLYLGGLEEVKTNALNTKINFCDRLYELECRLEDCQRKEEYSSKSLPLTAILDNLESRMIVLESNQEALRTVEQDKVKVEKIRTLIEKERDLAIAAALEATDAASRAEEVLESLSSEMRLNAKRMSIELEESLTLERDAILVASSEVRCASVKFCQERDSALVAALDVKAKAEEAHKVLENDMTKVRDDLAAFNIERVAAAAAVSEMSSLVLKAGQALTDMQVKGVQLEGGATVAIGRALKELHESQNKELEISIRGWEKAIEFELVKAKKVVDELDQLKARALIHVSEATTADSRIEKAFVVQKELKCFYTEIDQEVRELAATGNRLVDPEDTQADLARFKKKLEDEKDTVMKKDASHLNDQMKQVLTTLTAISHPILRGDGEEKLWHLKNKSENKAREEGKEDEVINLDRKIKALAEEQSLIIAKMSCVGRKMGKLEGTQTNLVRSLEEVRTSASGLKRSAAVWLPKFEAAEGFLKELQSRLGTLENSFNQKDFFVQSDVTGEKEDTVKVANKPQEFLHEDMNMLAEGEDGQKQTLATSLGGKLVAVESRLENVATATFTNLRILDAKVEHISVGVQSALEGAAMAETKCVALGEELVKFLRMLTSSRREFPGKMKHSFKNINSQGTNDMEGRDSVSHIKLFDVKSDFQNKVLSGLGKNSQKTNIRLGSGKIHVNVSHRSAVIAGVRLVRRKDLGGTNPER